LQDHDHELYEDDSDPIEGYCVRCRSTIEMETPVAVWTRRGMPATRGECPLCAGTVFRMGKSSAHHITDRPEAVSVMAAGSPGKRARLERDTAYVAFAEADAAIAEQIAADLEKIGIAGWLHEAAAEDKSVQWAGGVHPALSECSQMVLLLSPAVLESDSVTRAWQYFKAQRKPVVIAQLEPTATPDELRRSARFDFTESGDYKRSFRELVQALSR
jgi:hypothetical protein